MKLAWIFLFMAIFVAVYLTYTTEARQAVYYKPEIRSDVIVTKFATEPPTGVTDEEEISTEPGWMRRTLIKFGKVASNMGNSLGRHSVKVTSAIEKICEIIKTIVPVISAICGVGQFQFCSATTGVSDDLNSALKPNPGDLSIPD